MIPSIRQFALRLLHARQRKIDVDMLWPKIKELTRDLDHAREVFLIHAMIDPAWKDFQYLDLIAFVRTMK